MLQEWLGEKNAADPLTLSAPDNVTSEMGLALLDVADVIRPHPQVVTFLQDVEDDGFLAELPKPAGGTEARDAIEAYLDRYGMRCVGEIDITRPRWRERPTTLVPVILHNIKLFEPGAAERRFEQGRQEAQRKEQVVLSRLRAMPDGQQKADETKRMIDRVRTFIGYREYPKYGIVSRYFVYKQALLEEAQRLVQTNVLREKEDIFYLTFQELHDVVRTNHVDDQLIQQRKDAFRSYRALTYRRDDVPAGALIGLPVSAGEHDGLDVGQHFGRGLSIVQHHRELGAVDQDLDLLDRVVVGSRAGQRAVEDPNCLSDATPGIGLHDSIRQGLGQSPGRRGGQHGRRGGVPKDADPAATFRRSGLS